jgi:predicted house-cleaning noncanonical NTP pyrophosphatase (MazG superfamily)
MELKIDFSKKYMDKTEEELGEILEKMKEETAGKYAYGEEIVDLHDFSETGIEEKIRNKREIEILWIEDRIMFGGAIELEME